MTKTKGIAGKSALALNLMMVLAALLFCSSCSKDKPVQYRKTVNGVTITVSPVKGNFIMGKNDGMITLADSSGKMISQADVQVRFFTPYVRGEIGHNISPIAFFQDKDFRFHVDFPKAGEWRLELVVLSPELQGPPITTDFVINVRPR